MGEEVGGKWMEYNLRVDERIGRGYMRVTNKWTERWVVNGRVSE